MILISDFESQGHILFPMVDNLEVIVSCQNQLPMTNNAKYFIYMHLHNELDL